MTLRERLGRSPLLTFFAIVFGITWSLGAVSVLARDWVDAHLGSITATHPAFFVAVYAPSLVAIALTALIEGGSGVRALLGRLLLWRVRWHRSALLLVGLPVSAVAVARLVGSTEVRAPDARDLGALLAAALPALLLDPGPLGEELGWRGFALPRLLERWSAVTASLVLGVIWAVWHLPGFLQPGIAQSSFPVPVFFLGIVSLSVLSTWLYVNSGGSVFLPFLLHWIANNLRPLGVSFTIGTLVAAAWALAVVLGGGLRGVPPRSPAGTGIFRTLMAESPAAPAITISDRYVTEGELGRGGMATVYLAQDRKHGRKVAIKVLQSALAAALGPERFLREIQIAARLAHPHILPLIDSGESEGLLYYVTPHIPQGSLRQRLVAQGRLTPAEAVRIAREVGAALDYAHREGIVHRDVKPENILFADDHAVLADFGIARAVRGVSAKVVTGAGMALGTPEYMSPEQAAGEQDLTGASDLYSLACVVYEMLTGEPPIQGEGARATMARQVTETPRPVRALRPDVPVPTARALARALAKDPADRFATVAEFVEALQHDRAGEGPELLAATRGPCIAVLPFVNASPDPENEYLSDGITDELISALAGVEGLRVASRTSVFALKGKPQDVRAVGALLGASWVLEGMVRRSGDRLRIMAQLTSTEDGRLLWSERYDRTFADMFAIQEEIARTIVDTLRTTSFADLAAPVARRYTRNITAYSLYLQGRYAWNKRTQEGTAEAIRHFEEAIAEDPSYAPAYAGLSDSYALQLDYRSIPTPEGFGHARTYARKAIEIDDSVAEAHASLAWVFFIYDWEWNAARREFQRAIELDPRYPTAHQWYSFLLITMGRLDEALTEVRTALELDPASVSIRRSVGWAHYYARKYEVARHHMIRAVTMNPTAEETYRILGLVLAQQEEWAEAERVIREGMAHASGPNTIAALGYVLARAGRRAEAEAALAHLDKLRHDGYVSAVADATVHLGLGNPEQALDWMERAYDERRGWMAYLKVNPILDPLRGHPRFEALVRRMRL